MSILTRVVRALRSVRAQPDAGARGAGSDLRADLRASETEVLATTPIESLDSADAMLADLLLRIDGLVGLSGTLDGVEVEALIDMVRSNERTGTLWIRTPDEVLSFVLRRGRIARIAAQGDVDNGDRLGDILVGMRALSEEDLHTALAISASGGRLLGEVLVAERLVPALQVREALREQMLTRLLRALELSSAAYAFRRTDVVGDDESWREALDPHTLIERRAEPRD